MTNEKIRTLFFDCDDTLYPFKTGVAPTVRANIDRFLRQRLNVPSGKASALRRELFAKYGTTLRGLQKEFRIDAKEYYRFVHGSLPYHDLIKPDPFLAKVLAAINREQVTAMYIFTNADFDHVMACLRALNISSQLFDGIIDVPRMDFHNKPEEDSYRIALDIANEKDPRRAVLFDDSHRNVAGAHKYGIHAVHVLSRPEDKAKHFSYNPPVKDLPQTISSLHDLPHALPFLFSSAGV